MSELGNSNNRKAQGTSQSVTSTGSSVASDRNSRLGDASTVGENAAIRRRNEQEKKRQDELEAKQEEAEAKTRKFEERKAQAKKAREEAINGRKSSEEIKKEREAKEAQESRARELEIAEKDRLEREHLQQQRDLESQQREVRTQAHDQRIADALRSVNVSQSEERREADLKKIQDDLDRKSAGRQQYLDAVEEHRGVEYLEDRLSRSMSRSGSADVTQGRGEGNVQSVQQNSVEASLVDELGDDDQDEKDEFDLASTANVQGQTNIQNDGVDDENEYGDEEFEEEFEEEEAELDEAEDLDEEVIVQQQDKQIVDDGNIITQQNTLVGVDELGEEEDNEYEDDFDLEPEPVLQQQSAVPDNRVDDIETVAKQNASSRTTTSSLSSLADAPSLFKSPVDQQVLDDRLKDMNEMREGVDEIVSEEEERTAEAKRQADIQAQIIREQELAKAAATPLPDDDELEGDEIEEIFEEDQEEVDNGLGGGDEIDVNQDLEVEDMEDEVEEDQPENDAAADEERRQAELQAQILREQELARAATITRAEVFNDFKGISDISEGLSATEKADGLKEILDSDRSKNITDRAFRVFSDVANDVLNTEHSDEDKTQFIASITRSFESLGNRESTLDEQGVETAFNSIANGFSEDSRAKFGSIITTRFQEFFGREMAGAINVPAQQNENVDIDEITEEFLFGRDEEELEETLETAAKEVAGAIKIDAGRKQVFENFRAILTDDTVENKLESTKQFLQNPDVVAALDKDTSLGLFAGIVSEVADHGAGAEDRLGFIKALTEKFGHLGEDVDVNDKEKESQNIGRAFEGIRADIANNPQFAPFEEIVTRRFQGVFAEAVQALNGVDPEAVKNLAQKNLQAAQKPQDPAAKTLEEQQQNDKKAQDELSAKEQEKGKFTGKKSGDNLFDDLGPTDFAKAGFSVMAVVALSVAFPGFGTIIGIAIAGGIYGLSEKKESAIDRSRSKKDLENVLETGVPESARMAGKAAVQEMRDATTGFVRSNTEEMEEQKSGLRAASQRLGEANKTAQMRRDQQTTVTTDLDPENRENEDPNRKALQSAIQGLRGKSVQGGGKATDIVPTQEARQTLEEENKKANVV